ncbi:carbohydrate ABC transporter permease [Arachnia propionica]|uniref:Carbohydrate ABC transporter permease n=1 Tax=Arachnia propionica TaxID=1750 RepID=A0A3P1WUD0_9ACTN|nr:carbohydrate ABC transporter permease [Arachnia propionica]RRD49000.1 carbohydrate ABC transporter permease [Arachnia propionica]
MSTTIAPVPTTAATRSRGRVGQERTNWPVTILLILGSVTVLVPLYVTVSMAFKTTEQSTDLNAFSLPSPFSFEGIKEAWELTNFPRAFLVSLIVTLVAVAGSILISSMASYAIVRNWDRKFFRWSFFYLLAAMFIPFPVVALPQVRLTGLLGLDNYVGVALLHIVFSLAFNTLLFTAYLRSIPLELEESMRVDGATTAQTFWKLIFPLLAPMAATVGIFSFLHSWNDFMMPSLIISQPEWQTIPVVNNIFQTQFSNNYNVAFSSYLMAMAPAILVYILAQRWVMSGLTQGAIK